MSNPLAKTAIEPRPLVLLREPSHPEGNGFDFQPRTPGKAITPEFGESPDSQSVAALVSGAGQDLAIPAVASGGYQTYTCAWIAETLYNF